MRIIILGSGTSHGVPMIGCDCAVCRSDNPKNRRFRPSIAVQHNGRTILVDTTPELRLQALTCGLDRVDAVLFTHTHADHIFGLDDLRRFSDLSGQEIPVYGDEGTLEDIRRIYRYIFMETQAGGGKPRIQLNLVPEDFELFGVSIRSFYVMHGRLPVLAYRFGDAAYVTDVNAIPDEAMEKLQNLDLLILDAVRFAPHVTHFGLYQALEVVEKLKPRQTLFTHLSHQFDHDVVNAELPPGTALAYDGQTIDL
jgi:phosphoribosyl 1,2-cyclic phosphate phosphodiesterase